MQQVFRPAGNKTTFIAFPFYCFLIPFLRRHNNILRSRSTSFKFRPSYIYIEIFHQEIRSATLKFCFPFPWFIHILMLIYKMKIRLFLIFMIWVMRYLCVALLMCIIKHRYTMCHPGNSRWFLAEPWRNKQ